MVNTGYMYLTKPIECATLGVITQGKLWIEVNNNGLILFHQL